MADIDLGFEHRDVDDNQDKQDLSDNKDKDKDKDNLNDIDKDKDKDKDKDDDKDKDKDKDDDDKDKDKDNKEIELTEGTKIEIGETTYTVDNEGNLVDDKGAIFKQASEVAEYLKTLEQSDEDATKELNIDAIKEAIGIEITDDNDKPVEFENSPEGIKQYVNAVLETSQQEVAEAAVNTLFEKYPILSDFLNYYISNGNSAEGFSGKPDRSNIVVDENNEAQQEEIIRTAWKEQNRKGNIDDYINYLKSSGILAQTAKEELEGLKELDAAHRKELSDKAKALEEEEQRKQEVYWKGVKEVIDSKKLAGYKIPDTILIERDGKKIAATPNDFFNYVYRVDKNGNTQYQLDLMKESAESRRDDELLRAYLKFTGGNYGNLVDMAINEKEVNKLRFKAKENTSHKTTYKITPPAKSDNKNVDLGY